MSDQLSLTAPDPSAGSAASADVACVRGDDLVGAAASSPRSLYSHRERVLATVIAGFRWPGRKGWDGLTKAQQNGALNAASLALDHVKSYGD